MYDFGKSVVIGVSSGFDRGINVVLRPNAGCDNECLCQNDARLGRLFGGSHRGWQARGRRNEFVVIVELMLQPTIRWAKTSMTGTTNI